ncbi:hypothetical protein GCM10027066_22700 [Dyella jejuensis]
MTREAEVVENINSTLTRFQRPTLSEIQTGSHVDCQKVYEGKICEQRATALERDGIMTSSLLIKISIGLAIFLVMSIYQIKKIREFTPSLLDFSQTTDISGVSSYLTSGRVGASLVDGKVFFCGAGYSGGDGPCRALAKLPKGSKITVAAATLKTSRGTILYAMNVKFNSQEVYKISPEKALREWLIGSCIGMAIMSVLSVSMYFVILIMALKPRGNANG